MHQSSTEPIILNYKRRRFDGGPEVELIAYLEAQQRQKDESGTSDLDDMLAEMASDEADTPNKSKAKRIGEVFFIGPLEIFVGGLGMLTTGIATTVFKAFVNPALGAQSRSVYNDCWETFKQGWLHLAKAPLRAFHIFRG